MMVDGKENGLPLRSPSPLSTLNQQPLTNEWRNAVDLRHTPVSRSALVSTEARPARPVDIPNWSAWQDLHLQPFRLERNASALGYTRMARRAEARRAKAGCPRPGLHRHSARFKCAVSALDYVGEMVPREGVPPPTSPF